MNLTIYDAFHQPRRHVLGGVWVNRPISPHYFWIGSKQQMTNETFGGVSIYSDENLCRRHSDTYQIRSPPKVIGIKSACFQGLSQKNHPFNSAIGAQTWQNPIVWLRFVLQTNHEIEQVPLYMYHTIFFAASSDEKQLFHRGPLSSASAPTWPRSSLHASIKTETTPLVGRKR